MFFDATLKFEKRKIEKDKFNQLNSNVAVNLMLENKKRCRISARYCTNEEISLLIAVSDRYISEVDLQLLVKSYTTEINIEGVVGDVREIGSIDFFQKSNNSDMLAYYKRKYDEFFEVENEMEDWNKVIYLKKTYTLKEDVLTSADREDLGVYRAKVENEIAIIGQNKNECFVGHPVHYLIKGLIANEVNGILFEIIDALNVFNRLKSYRVSKLIHFNNTGKYATDDIESNMKMSFGSSMLIDIRSEAFEIDGPNEIDEYIRILADNMMRYSNRILFHILFEDEKDSLFVNLMEQLETLEFVLIEKELMSYQSATDYLEKMVCDSKLNIDLFKGVLDDQQIQYTENDVNIAFQKTFSKLLKSDFFPEYTEAKFNRQNIKREPLGRAYDQLQEMIGLAQVKKLVDEVLCYQRALPDMQEYGINTEGHNMHMVFMGPPGTAKTTAARLLGRILKDNGVLSVGNFYEAGRSDIIAEYVGWTAVKVKKLFKKAKGSILFIDEAYSIVDDGKRSFAQEAIAAIVQEMENMRDDIIVIFAGYPEEMKVFINQNPGLKSRIGFTLDFPDYSSDELVEIAEQMISKKGYKATDEVYDHINKLCINAMRESNFGNGRFIRNIIEEAELKHIHTLYGDLNNIPDKAKVLELAPSDFKVVKEVSLDRTEYRNKKSVMS